MLNVGRTNILTGPAGSAGPERVLADGFNEIAVRVPFRQLTNLLNNFHGRERFIGSIGRTAVLAALAGGAGVGVEEVFPGQVGNGGGAELLDRIVFHVDGGNVPLGFKGGQKGVGAGGKDMAQLGVGDGAEEAEHQQQMNPPEDLVGYQQGSRSQRSEEVPAQQAAGGKAGQLRVLLQFGGRHAGPFDQEPGRQDRKKQLQNDVVIPDDLQPLWLYDKTADKEPGQHDDGQDARDIQYQRKSFVEFAGEQVELQQRRKQIDLKHDQHGANKENQKAPEDGGMEHAAVRDPKHLGLAEHLRQQQLDPFVVPVAPVERLTLPPDRQTLPESPD